MKKIIVTSVIALMMGAGIVSAHDCGLVITGDPTQIAKSLPMTYQSVISQSGYIQALINLKAYCCTKVMVGKCTEKEKLPASGYPQSAYLFDHLLDVTMRRLDGIQSLAYGLEPDIAGKSWRAYITKVAEDPHGVQAKTIESTYTSYRTLHAGLTKDTEFVLKNYDKPNSETFSLGDKYNTLCGIIKSIAELQNTDIIIGKKNETNSFYRKCNQLTAKRVNQESAYVQTLMMTKSAQLLDETMKAYTKTYFVEDKLMKLRNLINKTKDTFQTIVKQAAASKSCSK